MPRRTAASLLALALAITLGGCGKSGSPTSPVDGSSSADEAEIMATLSATPEVLDESAFEANDPVDASSSPSVADGALAAIQPLRFWRRITDIDRRFTFAFSDTDSTGRPTRAVVTVHRTLRGTFNILAGAFPDANVAASWDTARSVLHKRLLDHGVRRILLLRVNEPWRARASWKVAATSGAVIVSQPRDQAPTIGSVHIEAANLDLTITQPLDFWRLRRIPRLEAGSLVRVTVTTGASDDVVYLLRLGRRVALESQGDGTHVGEFTVGDEPGLRHVAVNAFSHGTLFDDQEPYESRAWVLPYVVRAEELVPEYRPVD